MSGMRTIASRDPSLARAPRIVHRRPRRSVTPTADARRRRGDGGEGGRVSFISCFPVKGMPRVSLQETTLATGGCVPHDREWAVMLGSHAHEWDPDHPEKVFVARGYRGEHHSSKVKFHQLINAEALADVRLRYDGVSKRLTLLPRRAEAKEDTHDDDQHEEEVLDEVARDVMTAPLLDARLDTPEGVAEAERFFDGLLGDAVQPSADGATRLRLVTGAPGVTHQFANVGGTADKLLLHLVNHESVRDLERRTGRVIDVHRFRANVVFEGVPAWKEWDWFGRRLRIGEVELLVTEPTIRCPATEVNPATGERDMPGPPAGSDDPPALLNRTYPDAKAVVGELGEMALGGPDAKGGYVGFYARVVRGGNLRVGDELEVV